MPEPAAHREAERLVAGLPLAGERLVDAYCSM
jgi:hypothetical protein